MKNLDLIELVVAQHMDLELGFMACKKPKGPSSDARTMVLGIARQNTDCTCQQIGDHFGRCNSNVSVAAKRHQDLYETELPYRSKVEAIKDQLLNGVPVGGHR